MKTYLLVFLLRVSLCQGVCKNAQSPIEINFDDTEGYNDNLEVKFHFSNLNGLPIDYEKDDALLKLAYEGGQTIFTDTSGT